jgi:hypothetical protein
MGRVECTVLVPEDLEVLRQAVVQLISLRLGEALDAPTILSLQKDLRQLTTEVREVGENSEDPLVSLLRDELRNTTKNSEYYRGLVVEIGEKFGVAARTADDGSVADGVLCAKVPELVAKALRNLRIARESFAIPPSVFDQQPEDPRSYINGVPRYVKCRKCGNEGLAEAEFISPHTGLCAPCDKKVREGL